MYPTASAGPDQPTYISDAAQLPVLLQQLVADLDDRAITYLLEGHYYDRTNHPRYRHFPAVFALRQGEASNFEVGPDFLAFDTEFIRYPDRGEPHYPGPWTDRFRATVPFAQIYQLCRQVLTVQQQQTAQISYGPETLVYYNSQVHKNYITPQEMNQPYAAPAGTVHPLVAVMSLVADGLDDPTNHYLVNTSYFESPDGPVMMGTLHLNTHTVWKLRVEDDHFTCKVLLGARNRQAKSAVRVDYAQVWQVLRNDEPQFDLSELAEEDILYYEQEVLSSFVRQGPAV